ncbi:hypothetical protein [Paenibacillus sp. NPDC057967]|uniref:hypothetical protein n=1 Tax=Paenibacillus sp. NPDC057967 TaxID=3346293 RepID=UPI0036DDE7B8
MHRRTVGVAFIVIAAFLYSVRYLTAAIYGSNLSSWSSELFADMLTYVGSGPLVLSWIALIVGIGFFYPDIRKVMKKKFVTIDENWKEAEIHVEKKDQN